MSIGIMIIGLNGVNASTFISGTLLMKYKLLREQYGITEVSPFDKLDLIGVDDLVFAGWDYFYSTQFNLRDAYGIVPTLKSDDVDTELRKITPYKGIHTDMDIPIENRFNYYRCPATVEEGIDIIRTDIRRFKNENTLTDIVMIYLGSPSKKVEESLKNLDYNGIIGVDIKMIPSGILYAAAAMQENVHFVDFTPSEILEFTFLKVLSEENKCQLSGRDGSTGQTMLKMTIAKMLFMRNLKVSGWYSTNILGNHDGFILSQPEYAETKLIDKKYGIDKLLGYDDFEHLVRIEYFKTRFDSKESWDSIDFTGWLDKKMHLKINWQGEDSILTAPILLDIIRLIIYGSKKKLVGFQKYLGVFYKHPFQQEGKSIEEMYIEMIDFYLNI